MRPSWWFLPLPLWPAGLLASLANVQVERRQLLAVCQPVFKPGLIHRNWRRSWPCHLAMCKGGWLPTGF